MTVLPSSIRFLFTLGNLYLTCLTSFLTLPFVFYKVWINVFCLCLETINYIGSFMLANWDWIWTETGLVSDLPVAFTLDWSSFGSSFWWAFAVQHFGHAKHYKTNSEQLFHHSNQIISSPNSVWLRIQTEQLLNPPHWLGGFESSQNPVQVQSKSNLLAFTPVD